jgi:hypothetical protein
VVLDGVMLRLGEHVEAEDGLEQGRVAERERRVRGLPEAEADGDAASLPRPGTAVKRLRDSSSFERIS